jgi:hypothetical protein
MPAYKTANLEMEFLTIHPVLIDLITRLEAYSKEAGLPEPVITECYRTADDMERIYWRQMMRDFSLKEDAARKKARNKDSLHLYGCGVDLRDKHYTVAQKKQVVAWLRAEMAKISKKPGFWEFLPDMHGTGSHLHVGRKDEMWIRNYRAKTDNPLKISVGLSKHNEDPSA